MRHRTSFVVWLLVVLWGSKIFADQQPKLSKTIPSVPPKNSTLETLLKRAQEISRKTSKIRGLRMKQRIKMGTMTRKQVQTHIEQKMNKEFTASEVAAEERVLKLLGLIPPKMSYRKEILLLLKDQVAGFYDPENQQLNLATWIPIALQEPALSHEICHALQDQHFRIKRFIKPLKENSDQHLARVAVLEGDCTAIMIEYVLASQGLDLSALSSSILKMTRKALTQNNSPRLQAAPRFLREVLMFPYLYGLNFIQKLRSRHTWRFANQLYNRMPISSEQMMHYRKYWSREKPAKIVNVKLPILKAYKPIKKDVLGEFQIYLYLTLGNTDAIAERAAAGWNGDLLIAYQKESLESSLFLIHLSVWDSEADAIEMVNAQRHLWTSQKLTAIEPTSQSNTYWVYQDANQHRWSVKRRGQVVVTLHRAHNEIEPTLQTQVWDQWKVLNLKKVKGH